MIRSSWKRSERDIGRLVGGERVPVSGRARGAVPDIAHRWLSIEVKSRASLPRWIHDALDQASASARGLQLPVAVLHHAHHRHTDDVVCLRLSDFVEWFGDLPEAPEDTP